MDISPTPHRELAVSVRLLRRALDPSILPFESTRDIPFDETIGQPRAFEAIRMAAEIKARGFNLYVAGAPGSGRESLVRSVLSEYARQLPAPPDRVYVHRFDDPDHPTALELPPGQGQQFKRDIEEFVQFVQRSIPRAFDSESYEKQRNETATKFQERKSALLQELRAYALKRETRIEMTAGGFLTIPLMDAKPIAREDFDRLRPEKRAEIELRTKEVHDKTSANFRAIRELDRREQEEVAEIDRQVARFALAPAIEELHDKYGRHPDILNYLTKMQDDILDHLPEFRGNAPESLPALGKLEADSHLWRYQVNVFVENDSTNGAPIVFERNPTYYNLFGKISYRATFGAMVTDFRQLKPGATHRANGGFLVLNVLDVLKNPFSWEALKRALFSEQIQMENLGEQLTAVPVATLRPKPIPLDVKVILIGTPTIYRLLFALDEDFHRLFKVKADFSPEMKLDAHALIRYARMIGECVKNLGLLHFDRSAIAEIASHGARLVSHQRKLTTQVSEITDLAAESDHVARATGAKQVSAEHVETAIHQREFRSNLSEERLRELITEGTLMIDTQGARVGQVNGIAVHDLGDYAFGRPSRITASVSIGKDGIQSIERESKLSGKIHSKGFMILSGYLKNQYAQTAPLALAATLTFEQSYDEIEGDSASSTELYALISALSGAPLNQAIGVTGSVDQQGMIQAVGGINEKIEGFFAVCKDQGLTGQQGVMIPMANVQHLMLKREVIRAVEQGMFTIWAVKTLDQGIAILTGLEPATVHRRVLDRIGEYAELSRKFREPPAEAAEEKKAA